MLSRIKSFTLGAVCLSASLGVIANDYGQPIQIPMKDKGMLWNTEIKLEATLYKPEGEGPFPTVIFNHGSTGGSKEYARQTVNPWGLGKVLNEKNIALIVPMRRGRGNSQGRYKEQYTCDSKGIAQGFDYAMASLDASYQFLLKQSWVDKSKVMLVGNSRGGILSLRYASEHPDSFTGVINFSGGWVDDTCASGGISPNEAIFAAAGSTLSIPTLFIYGRNDSFYADQTIEKFVSSYKNAGGSLDFKFYKLGEGVSGHDIFYKYYHLWSGVVGQYLLDTEMDVN
ncbi:dienelactone hydrolase family protein [Vibrio sp. WXL103]|uniref:dienelactone hydrolase family protein n=1 Tax=Vibrio sp. WXL103 TaxID=3450710 RepID=UPI003EC5E9A8